MNITGLIMIKKVINSPESLKRLCEMIDRYMGSKEILYIPSIDKFKQMSSILTSTPGYNDIFGDPRLMRGLVVATHMYNYPQYIKAAIDKYNSIFIEENTSEDDEFLEFSYCNELYNHLCTLNKENKNI